MSSIWITFKSDRKEWYRPEINLVNKKNIKHVNTWFWIFSLLDTKISCPIPWCVCLHVNKILPGFTKDMKWNISNENVWTLLLFQLTLLHRHVYEFHWDSKCMGGKYKWITQPDLLPFAVVSLLVFAPLFKHPPKPCLDPFAAVLLYSTHLVSIGPACLWPYTNGAFILLCSSPSVAGVWWAHLAPLSCGSRRIIQVDAAHWWWLRRDPPPTWL